MSHRTARWPALRRVSFIVVTAVVVGVAASCRHEEEQRAAPVTTERAGLAFTRYASAEQPSVWVADADGSHARRVVAGAYSPRLSPDGRRLAYMVPGDEPDSLPSLFVRDIAGGRPRRVGRAFGYKWSPDGTHVAAQGPQSLVLFDIRSGKRETLVHRRLVGGFSFAPAGDAIAYGRWNGGVGPNYRSDIFVIGLETGRITRLTRNRHSDKPVWGRRWIVYRRFPFSGDWSICRLHLMRPDGSLDRLFARWRRADVAGADGPPPARAFRE